MNALLLIWLVWGALASDIFQSIGVVRLEGPPAPAVTVIAAWAHAHHDVAPRAPVSSLLFFLSSTAAARALHLQRPPRDVPTAALPSKTTRSPQLQISRTTSGGLKIEIELNRQVLRISCEFSGDEMDLFGRNDQQTDHITWAGAARRDNSTPSIRRSHPA